ncbi:MAG: hypothetical protein WD079_04350, partial [Phycisphaeraceae bacterium]
LLVVVGIIALLMAILLPALNRARAEAYKVTCAGNLRQWGTALAMRAMDENGQFVRPNEDQPDDGSNHNFPNRFSNATNPSQVENSEIHRFYATYLEPYDVGAARSGESIVHACPLSRRQGGMRDYAHDVMGYYYFPKRANGNSPYTDEARPWVTKTRFDSAASRAPIMSDSQGGNNLPWPAPHANPAQRSVAMGGNYLFEDGSVSWYQAADIRHGCDNFFWGPQDFVIDIPGMVN